MFKKLLLVASLCASHSIFSQTQLEGDTVQFGKNSYQVQADGYLSYFGVDTAIFIYREGIQLGGIAPDSSLHVSAQTYRQDRVNFFPGPISTDVGSYYYYARTWTVTRALIDSVRQGLFTFPNFPPAVIQTWPAHGRQQYGESYHIAPFVDVDGDGIYNWQTGDYPYIEGDIATLAVFNDQNPARDTTGGDRMVCEGYVLYWMYDQPGIAGRTLFRKTVVTNKSGVDYHNTYMANFSDNDAGNIFGSDLTGTDVARHGTYGYHNHYKSFQKPGKAPYSGTLLLEGPIADYGDGLDNDWDGCADAVMGNSGFCIPEDSANGIVERLTLSNTMYFVNSSNPAMGPPATDKEYFNYMRSIWRNDSVLRAENPSGIFATANGDGYSPTGSGNPVNYMFPGDSYSPYPQWQPSNPSQWYNSPSNGSDKRIISSMGPFTWEAGESISYMFASMWGTVDTTNYANIFDSIQADFDNILNLHSSNPISVEEVNSIEVELEFGQGPNTLYLTNAYNREFNLEVIDLNGRIVLRSVLLPSSEKTIDVGQLPPGVYVIRTNDGSWNYKWIK